LALAYRKTGTPLALAMVPSSCSRAEL